MKVYIRNQQRLIKVNHQRIRRYLRKALHILGLHWAELSILLVNDRRIRELNRQYRDMDKTTDVLSFPQLEDWKLRSSEVRKFIRLEDKQLRIPKTSATLRFRTFVLGDIVINLHQAKRQSAEHGLTFNEELGRLMLHGLLHLVGYDHEKNGYQKKKMESKERELLRALKRIG